jgi:hypothetical protein
MVDIKEENDLVTSDTYINIMPVEESDNEEVEINIPDSPKPNKSTYSSYSENKLNSRILLKKKSKTYRIWSRAHSKAAEYYAFWYKFWALIGILISAAAGVIIEALELIPDWACKYTNVINLGFFGIIMAIIAIKDFMDFGKSRDEHKQISADFDKLVLLIEEDLSDDSREVNFSEVLRNIDRKRNEINTTSVDLPSHILKQYENELYPGIDPGELTYFQRCRNIVCCY